MNPWLWRFAVAIVLDIIDMTLGRIPVIGTVWDVIMTAAGFWLWRRVGLFAGWEIIDITDQFDGFVPSLTIAGIVKFVQEKGWRSVR